MYSVRNFLSDGPKCFDFLPFLISSVRRFRTVSAILAYLHILFLRFHLYSRYYYVKSDHLFYNIKTIKVYMFFYVFFSMKNIDKTA